MFLGSYLSITLCEDGCPSFENVVIVEITCRIKKGDARVTPGTFTRLYNAGRALAYKKLSLEVTILNAGHSKCKVEPNE
jgi:hypothetical protein